MTSGPTMPDADPADVAEQQADVVPPTADDEPSGAPDELPLEANEADVAEQLTVAAGIEDDPDED